MMASMNATPWLLARFSLVQSCYQIGTVLMMSVGILAATPLAPAPLWAALPLALSVVGTFAALFPASALMKRWGRKRGLLFGTFLGATGVAGIAAGLLSGQFVLVCAGFLVYGLHQAFLQFLRFMAMETAGPERAAGALSWVLVGGIPAAFLGPLVGLWGRDLASVAFAGSYSILLVVLAGQALIIASLPSVSTSAPSSQAAEPARPWRQRLADPSLWLALTAASFSYGLMVMLMAASPLAMHQHGHPLSASTFVLQAHVLGMYVPSFFSGVLVRKWGPRRLIAAGLAVFVLELILALQGTGFVPFFLALTMLGVGWNFLYVGGTNLLVTRYRPAEKAGVQAFNDSFLYLFATVSTFGAGAWEVGMGWDGLQLLSLPFLAVVFVLWLVARGPRKPQELK
jgi:MFS family permease